MSGRKYNVYIQHKHIERWEDKPKYARSTWVNKMLEREAEEEKQEALANPVWDEVTQTWSDSDLA